jgi:hypothetical protein
MLPNPVQTIEETPLSEDVREFCERHNLSGHLAKALEFARRYFSIVGDPVILWEHDPENDDEYLVLEIEVRGSVSECVQAHVRYVGEWTQFATLPEVRLIRLSPDIIE